MGSGHRWPLAAPGAVALLAVLAPLSSLAETRAEARAEGGDDPELSVLLPRVASYAMRFEEMKRRGSFTLDGRMEELDSSGHATSTKAILVRSVATPAARRNEILRYVEDGADRTAEARQKAEKRAAEGQGTKRRDLRLPFLGSEQARYRFALVERDGPRVKLSFTPHAPAEDAWVGTAWVEAASGDVLTLGLSPSKTSMFVDRVEVTVRFDLPTPLGRAPKTITFDARGGILLFRKHVHGSGTLTDPSLGF